MGLRSRLHCPWARDEQIDRPETTRHHWDVIRKKQFLLHIYEEWYSSLTSALPQGPGAVLEVGSGGGFIKEILPDVISSDVLNGIDVDVVIDATERWPFDDAALRGVVMTNVLHHLARPRLFFYEATRCLRPGGRIVMLEPWVSLWSRFVFGWLHHEPFDPMAIEWELHRGGPLSGANGALPWILFSRDRNTFEQEFPLLKIRAICPTMPFRYILSGGFSMPALVPGFTHALWRALENILQPQMRHVAMFSYITLERMSGRTCQYNNDGKVSS